MVAPRQKVTVYRWTSLYDKLILNVIQIEQREFVMAANKPALTGASQAYVFT